MYLRTLVSLFLLTELIGVHRKPTSSQMFLLNLVLTEEKSKNFMNPFSLIKSRMFYFDSPQSILKVPKGQKKRWYTKRNILGHIPASTVSRKAKFLVFIRALTAVITLPQTIQSNWKLNYFTLGVKNWHHWLEFTLRYFLPNSCLPTLNRTWVNLVFIITNSVMTSQIFLRKISISFCIVII